MTWKFTLGVVSRLNSMIFPSITVTRKPLEAPMILLIRSFRRSRLMREWIFFLRVVPLCIERVSPGRRRCGFELSTVHHKTLWVKKTIGRHLMYICFSWKHSGLFSFLCSAHNQVYHAVFCLEVLACFAISRCSTSPPGTTKSNNIKKGLSLKKSNS